MTERLLTYFAFAVFLAFLLILVGKVMLVDLALVAAVTIALAGYDLLVHGRRKRG